LVVVITKQQEHIALSVVVVMLVLLGKEILLREIGLLLYVVELMERLVITAWYLAVKITQ